MVQETEHTFNLLIVGVLLLIDAFQTLLSIPTRGIFIDQTGSMYDGEWLNDQYHGKGTE